MSIIKRLRHAAEHLGHKEGIFLLLSGAADDIKDMKAALEEAEDYFDQRADAEYLPDQAAPVGNEEMRLLTIIRAALAKARGEGDD